MNSEGRQTDFRISQRKVAYSISAEYTKEETVERYHWLFQFTISTILLSLSNFFESGNARILFVC